MGDRTIFEQAGVHLFAFSFSIGINALINKNMIYKNVFIITFSNDRRGSFVILKQIIQLFQSKQKISPWLRYYIFTSIPEMQSYQDDTNFFINIIHRKNIIHTIFFEQYFLHNWSKKTNIFPDFIISLQNIPFYFKACVPQWIYFHNPAIIASLKTNIFKKEHLKMFIYYKIIPLLIRRFLNSNITFIVQTKWVEKALKEKFHTNNTIYIFKPIFKNNSSKSININIIKKQDKKIFLFYPASILFFKNHDILLSSICKIKETNKLFYDKLCLILTVDKSLNKEFYKKIQKLNISEAVDLIGHRSHEDILAYYKIVDALVFPSYLETFGLPLLEAANEGLPILVSDTEFSREVLQFYQGTTYLDPFKKDGWIQSILNISPNMRYKNISLSEFHNKESWESFFIKMLEAIQ